MQKKETKKPVILLTGYLGSGKTTVMNELLKNEQGKKLALIVNDIGKINIDAKLLRDSTASSKHDMIEMQNGCICCTLQNAFMKEINKLAEDSKVEAVLVEASGVSNPANIGEGFQLYSELMPQSQIYLSSIITVADADRIYTEFLGGIKEAESGKNDDDPDIINLVMDQIEYCSLILLNKCDLLTRSQIDEVKKVIQELQPGAEIIETVRGKVDAAAVVNSKRFDFEKAENASLTARSLNGVRTEHDADCGITSFVFEERRPFDYDKFYDFLQNDYPEEIIRAKGYIWFADDDLHVQLFEQAGRNASVTEMSNWVCALPEKDINEILQVHPDAKDDWDKIYGDRLNQIVFIGKNYQESEIRQKLNSCLSTQPYKSERK